LSIKQKDARRKKRIGTSDGQPSNAIPLDRVVGAWIQLLPG